MSNTKGPKARVVVIIAQSHSGSHLLSQLLGAHPACLSIGELHNYDKFVNRRSGGNVTADYAQNALFAGLGELPEERWHEHILDTARSRDPSVTTLIDNSKRISWCRRLVKNERLAVLPVHLIRDPRAMIRYWMIRYESDHHLRRQRLRLARQAPLQAAALLTCPPLELYVRKWLIDNTQATRLLNSTGHPANVVTYHDLATRTTGVLETLMPRLGLPYAPEQLRYGEAAHHGTLKRDYREASETSRIALDVRWQAFLSADQSRTVSEDPRVTAYLDRLNLSAGPDGLMARD